ncbi:MAG: response regulator [Lachnospiraceae bacterium]|nr:response regulator [Lachnospiraceae bacterium]
MGYKALIVDDNAVNATVISGLLNKFHVESEVALDGAEAIARRDLVNFQIVFTDYLMPGIDGIGVGKQIRQCIHDQGKDIPVVLCTANVGAAGLAADVETGISYILKKPVKVQELEQVLQRYVDERLCLDNSQSQPAVSMLNIPGLDTAYAIRQAGGERLYLNILSEYHKAIKETCERLRKYEQTNDTVNYRIEVHGLKSSCRLVGAMELANLCEYLENETKSKTPMDLKGQTAYLLRIYESFIERLAPFIKQEESNQEQESISKEKAKEQFLSIRRLLEDFELDEAEELLEELQQYKLNEAYKLCLDKLSECIGAVDYEGGIMAIDACEL